MRTRQLDEAERKALIGVLERIENAAQAIAVDLRADLMVERDDRGKLPTVAFRALGFRAATPDRGPEHRPDG